jgi:hypothetical protein
MRRIGILVAGFVVGMGVLASPAFATFHLEMVNEVMLASGTGDSTVQFVELLDHGGTEEQFTPVFAPYRLAVYDGAGNPLGAQMLDPTGLRTAASANKEYLLSTPAADAALGVTGDAPLTVALPAGSGQACFEANPGAFSCLTWGTVSKPVETNSMGTGSVHGDAPPNGQSAQRQEDNSVVSASPTPKAKNAAGGGGGGGGGGGTPFAGVGIGTTKARVDRSGRVSLKLSCPTGSGGCTGRITLTTGKHHKPIGKAQFTLKDGSKATAKVKLSAAARKALARSGKVKARAVVRAKDAAGQSKQTSGKVVVLA